MSHIQPNPAPAITEKGVATLENGKATVTAAACKTTSVLIVTSNSKITGKADGIISGVELEAGKFKIENSTGAGAEKVSWAILA